MRSLFHIYYSEEKIPQKTLDIHLPDGQPEAVFLYMHGGGLEGGDKCGDTAFIAPYLTARGIGVVGINYRLYPNAVFPQFIEDAAEAVAWTYAYMKNELGCDKLYVGGSSAGGYLSMMLCFDSRYLEKAGLDPSAIAGYFHDAGQPTAHYNILHERGIDERRVIVDESAPLYFVGMRKSYPPMRFIVSDNDMENRYEQTVLMLSTLRHFGYKDCDMRLMHGHHCAYVLGRDENGDSLLAQMFMDFYSSLQR